MQIENEITIHAPAEKVWQVLTNSAFTRQYMYGCEIVSSWQLGQPFNWRGEYEGKPMVFVTGNLLVNEPNRHLAYTTFDPNGTYENIPANHLTVNYYVESHGDHTHLTITQGDYTKVADGEKRYNDAASQGGWSSLTEQIKTLAEAQSV